ncbi:uncharacterized protein STEHIDRAFT_154664 [Stereum hirsutum FP-91666 SS1]|uniref:uncharacterized protein n=1 Tax=Stereum hirsutum (strain FP-91666) TaxID=721885 RepID=UPI000440D2E8|nr:uncharacterized protein STEHIDRAFT_154664 [Stereum hirsutum FP-91666 SS1]EIM88957.1 hypothetical protein STEHIDRAFT_154664 [Stereum hirsutum FP-91666 SS1]
MGKRKRSQVQVLRTRKSPRFVRRAPPLLRLPPELLLELGRFCEEDVPALKATSQLLCAVYSRPIYFATKIFCGGLHFTADDVKRVERICKAFLGPLEHGEHVQFLAIYDFSYQFLETHSDELGATFAEAFGSIFRNDCVPNIVTLDIHSDHLSINWPNAISPVNFFRGAKLKNLRMFWLRVPKVNHVVLCAFLNKHPELVDVNIGNISSPIYHLEDDRGTMPVALSLPKLEIFSGPAFYFYCFGTALPSLSVVEVWMPGQNNVDRDEKMMMLPQSIKHLSYVRGAPGSPLTIEPVLEYLAKIAPQLEFLNVRYRAKLPGPWKREKRVEPDDSCLAELEAVLPRFQRLHSIDFTANTLLARKDPERSEEIVDRWTTIRPMLKNLRISTSAHYSFPPRL